MLGKFGDSISTNLALFFLGVCATTKLVKDTWLGVIKILALG